MRQGPGKAPISDPSLCAHTGAPSMATRVLSMSARLGPEEPVFAQLKPVLGPREPSLFPGPGPEIKQQPPGGGARIPGEEMVQVNGALRSSAWVCPAIHRSQGKASLLTCSFVFGERSI